MADNDIEMNAAVAYASSEPFVTTQLMTRAPAANEIGVRIVATGICHTDVMNKKNGLCSFPMVFGHEGVGIVDALGSDVSGFELGDHVVLSYDYCGRCSSCINLKPAYCHNHGALNFAGTRPNGEKTHRTLDSETANVYGSYFQQSSFATYALSHETNTIKVDKSLPLPLLAPLGCGVQTGAGTVFNTLEVKPQSSLVVFGCGCVGLSSIMAAKIAQARHIVAVDINQRRLQLARELGATHCLNSNDYDNSEDIVSQVRSIDDSGGCNYSIDTTGNPAVLRQAFDSCGPLGVTAMIAPGMPGTEVCIEMFGLLPGKALRGVIQGDSVSKTFVPKLIALWQRGEFPFDRMITMFNSLDNLESAVSAMERGEVVKPVVIVDCAYSES